MADKYFLDWTDAGKVLRKPANGYIDLAQILKDAYNNAQKPNKTIMVKTPAKQFIDAKGLLREASNDYINEVAPDVLKNRGLIHDGSRLLANPGKTVSNRVPVPYKNNQVMNIVQPGEAKRNAAKARLEAASRLPNDGEVIYSRTTKQTPRLTTAKTKQPLLTTSSKPLPNVGKNAETIDMLFGNPKNKFSDLKNVAQKVQPTNTAQVKSTALVPYNPLARNVILDKALKVAGPVLGIAGGYGQLRNAQNYGQDDLTRGFMKTNGLLDMAVGAAPILNGAANLASKVPLVGGAAAGGLKGLAAVGGNPVVQGTASLLGGYAAGRPVERFINKYVPGYRNAVNTMATGGLLHLIPGYTDLVNRGIGNAYNAMARNDVVRKVFDFLANDEPNKISVQNNAMNNNTTTEKASEQPNGNEQPTAEAQQNMTGIPYIPYNATPEQVAQILGGGEGVVGATGEMINERTANGQGYQGDVQSPEQDEVLQNMISHRIGSEQGRNQAGGLDIMAMLDKMYGDNSNRNITPENLALARLAGGYRRNPYYAQLIDKGVGSRAAEAAKAKIITEYMKEAQADKAVEGTAQFLMSAGQASSLEDAMLKAQANPKLVNAYLNYMSKGEANTNKLLIEDKKQLGATNRNYLDNYTRLQIALENNKYKLSPRDQMLVRGYVAAAANNPDQALWYYTQMNPEAREVLKQSVEEAGLGEREVDGKAADISAYQ